MSDSALKTAAYPAYTTAQLKEFVAAGRGNSAMVAEISRRDQVAEGNVSVMTPGERLRFVQTGRAR